MQKTSPMVFRLWKKIWSDNYKYVPTYFSQTSSETISVLKLQLGFNLLKWMNTSSSNTALAAPSRQNNSSERERDGCTRARNASQLLSTHTRSYTQHLTSDYNVSWEKYSAVSKCEVVIQHCSSFKFTVCQLETKPNSIWEHAPKHVSPLLVSERDPHSALLYHTPTVPPTRVFYLWSWPVLHIRGRNLCSLCARPSHFEQKQARTLGRERSGRRARVKYVYSLCLRHGHGARCCSLFF